MQWEEAAVAAPPKKVNESKKSKTVKKVKPAKPGKRVRKIEWQVC